MMTIFSVNNMNCIICNEPLKENELCYLTFDEILEVNVFYCLKCYENMCKDV